MFRFLGDPRCFFDGCVGDYTVSYFRLLSVFSKTDFTYLPGSNRSVHANTGLFASWHQCQKYFVTHLVLPRAPAGWGVGRNHHICHDAIDGEAVAGVSGQLPPWQGQAGGGAVPERPSLRSVVGGHLGQLFCWMIGQPKIGLSSCQCMAPE